MKRELRPPRRKRRWLWVSAHIAAVLEEEREGQQTCARSGNRSA